jgi:hypothetical protein
MDDQREVDPADDGRPVEVREGAEASSGDAEEELPDPSTVESLGY